MGAEQREVRRGRPQRDWPPLPPNAHPLCTSVSSLAHRNHRIFGGWRGALSRVGAAEGVAIQCLWVKEGGRPSGVCCEFWRCSIPQSRHRTGTPPPSDAQSLPRNGEKFRGGVLESSKKTCFGTGVNGVHHPGELKLRGSSPANSKRKRECECPSAIHRQRSCAWPTLVDRAAVAKNPRFPAQEKPRGAS